LSSQGYHVSIGQDDPAAVGQVIVTGGGVIVLDIGPPMDDWRSVLQALRRDIQTRAPILVLAAQTELDERLHAFTLGADDFLQEPFALAEVRARIDALHRRLTNTVVRGTASSCDKPVANGSALPFDDVHPGRPVLSVIIPARDEAQNLPSLLDEIAASLVSIEYELLVVDDGSVDHTWPLLVSRAAKDRRLRPLRHLQAVGQVPPCGRPRLSPAANGWPRSMEMGRTTRSRGYSVPSLERMQASLAHVKPGRWNRCH
jgi:DNA-binding response OmpR family regulator